MIPIEKVKLIINTYETLEKELASGDINKKDFVKKSKEYSNIGEIINEAKGYLGFEKEKKELEKNIKKQLLDFRKYIEKNCKNVGVNFTKEARSIHYDKKTSQGIYGKATAEETNELLEEGIEVATIPWIDKSEN